MGFLNIFFKQNQGGKREKNRIAIFDIDGTIFRKNLHYELLDELVFMRIFPREVKNQLVGIYGDWLNNEGTYEAYREKLVKLYEENLGGCKKNDIDKAAEIVTQFNVKRIYVFARDLIKELKGKYLLVAISGSPVEIVSKYSAALGFDFSFGSVYEVNEKGFYTGKAVFEPTKNKGAVVKQFVYENNLSLESSLGVGDTESDAAFLEIVEKPIAFNPNSNLKEIAKKKGWKIVVEKKDVIYDVTGHLKTLELNDIKNFL